MVSICAASTSHYARSTNQIKPSLLGSSPGKTSEHHIDRQDVHSFQMACLVMDRAVLGLPLGKLLDDLSEFRKGRFAQVQSDGIAWIWSSALMQPVCCRKVYGTADEPGINHFVVLLRWILSFHGRVADLQDRQLSAKTGMVKCHRLCTIPIEEEKGCQFHSTCDVSFSFDP